MALSTTSMQYASEITKFGKIRAISPFKVTKFGTDQKPMYDFLLVINTNLLPILHHFEVIAFQMSKIAIFRYPSCV